MSTKIYSGVRFPKNKLAEFVQHVKTNGLEKVYEQTKEMTKEVSEKSNAFIDYQEGYPKRNAWEVKCKIILDRIKDSGQSSERIPWSDMECGWKVWLPVNGHYALASPWGESLTEIKLPEWVEEYGYWDNTDKPDNMTTRNWTSRRKAWEIACEPWSFNHYMAVTIFEVTPGLSGGVGFCWLTLQLESKGKYPPKKR